MAQEFWNQSYEYQYVSPFVARPILPVEEVEEATAPSSTYQIIMLLLNLWYLGGDPPHNHGVRKSSLTGKVKRKRNGVKIGKYEQAYHDLLEMGAIWIEKCQQTPLVHLTVKGKEILSAGLQSPEFMIEGDVVSVRLAHALLAWIRLHEREKLLMVNGKNQITHFFSSNQ
jgi:hypothetical protein